MKFHLFFSMLDSGTNWGPSVLLSIGLFVVFGMIYLVLSEWYYDSPDSPDMVFDVISEYDNGSQHVRMKHPYTWRDRNYQDGILLKVGFRVSELCPRYNDYILVKMPSSQKSAGVVLKESAARLV